MRSRWASTSPPRAGRLDAAVGRASDDPHVGGHPPGDREHLAPAPVRRGQQPGGRVGPGADEEARVGAAEGLGGGIRVAEQHEVDPAAARDDLQQAQGGRGELLGVVDDDEAQPRAEPVERVEVGLEVVGRCPEDPGRVEGSGGGQGRHLVVLAQHVRRGHPLGPVLVGAEPGEVLGVEAQLDGPHQQVAQLAPEGARGQGEPHRLGPRRSGRLPRRVAGEQLTEDDVLLGPAEQPRRGVAGEGRGLAQDAVAERLVGACQRRRGGAAQPRGDGVAQPGGREPGGGEDEALVCARLAGPDPRGDDLDGNSGPTGARRPEHAQHGPAVVDDRALARVEHRGGGHAEGGTTEHEHP